MLEDKAVGKKKANFVLAIKHFVGMGREMTSQNSPQEPTNSPSEQLLSRSALARRWGCCKETIKRREREGVLPAIRFNCRLVRYRLSDILAIEAGVKGGEQ